MSSKSVLATLAALALAVSAPAASAASAKCRLMKIGELPVTMIGLKPVVSVKINGADARLMADTGAFFSMLNPNAAARLGVKSKTGPGNAVRVRGAGGEEAMSVGSARDFNVAGIPVKNVDFLIGGRGLGNESDGVLGQNMLGGVEIEYDLANGVLRLFRAQNCAADDVIAYWATEKAPGILPISRMTPMDRHITASAKVNGQPIRVMFDTGASRTVLKRPAADRVGVRLEGEGVVSGGLSGGVGRKLAENWIVPVDSFEIADEKVQHTRLRVADIALPPGADMLIGADFFLSHRVMISSSQRKLYFTYNGGPVFRLDRVSAAEAQADAAPEPSPPPATTDATASAQMDAAGYSRRGSASMARRDFPAAIADFGKAAELEPTEARHFHDRAIAKLGNRQPVLAMADLSQALKLKPDDRDALMTRGELYLMSRDLPSARADFDAAVRQAPNDTGLRLRIAGSYARAGQFEIAVAGYDQAIAAMPRTTSSAQALNDSCWARALWGRELEKALADCDAALKQGPRTSNMLGARGLVRLRLGQFDEAIADYDVALRMQPKAAWSLYGRGLAKQHKGLKTEGDADLEAAAALAPGLAAQAKRYGLTS